METTVSERHWSICGVEFVLELARDVFVPTSTSEMLAENTNIQPGETVIDLGCGSGFFSVLAAKRGAAKIYAVDVTPQAVALTRRNAQRNGVSERIEAYCGSLFEPLEAVTADLIIDDVSGISEAVCRATPWYPPAIPSGGPDGSVPTVNMLRTVLRYLRPNGRLVFPVLSLANEQPILQEAKRQFKQLQLRAQRLFPVPASLQAALQQLKAQTASGAMRLVQKGSRLCWQLRIFEAKSI